MDRSNRSAQRAPLEPLTATSAKDPKRSGPLPRARSAGRLWRAARLHRLLASMPRMASGRRANILLFTVTLAELVIAVRQTTALAVEDWIYLSQHVLVMVIAFTRRPPIAQDLSWKAALAVAISYVYPYAQVIYLDYIPGHVAWPAGGIALTTLAALLSLVALISIGRRFGVRPALRGLAMNGPYRLVRHPMYLAYYISDIGYQLDEWNTGTVLLMAAGWTSLIYRIRAEERMLSRHTDWAAYVRRTPYRLVPGLW